MSSFNFSFLSDLQSYKGNGSSSLSTSSSSSSTQSNKHNKTIKKREPNFKKKKAYTISKYQPFEDEVDASQYPPKFEEYPIQNGQPEQSYYTMMNKPMPKKDLVEPMYAKNQQETNITENMETREPYKAYSYMTNYYGNLGNSGLSNEKLEEKLNQLIYLLEKQQDENTENMVEELILYVFLGIFIIFVLDSFMKIGRKMK